jgi:hypothetical protein
MERELPQFKFLQQNGGGSARLLIVDFGHEATASFNINVDFVALAAHRTLGAGRLFSSRNRPA